MLGNKEKQPESYSQKIDKIQKTEGNRNTFQAVAELWFDPQKQMDQGLSGEGCTYAG